MRRSYLTVAALVVATSAAWAQEAHRAPILESAFSPLTKSDAPKLYKQWGKMGFDRINKATEAAVQITATSPKCDSVFLSGYSFDRSTPKKEFSVFVDCSNGERFYYTEAETQNAATGPTALSEGLEQVRDSDALKSCQELVKSKLNFPSTMDVSLWSSEVTRAQYGINVTLSFEAKNALGNELPYVAYCTVSVEKAELLSIKGR